jgi:CBS domain-containing protein
MRMKSVEEIMIPLEQYPRIKFWQPIREAIDMMCNTTVTQGDLKMRSRVLLVFDELDVLVGMVRRRDLMRGLEPRFLGGFDLNYRKKLFDIKIDPNLAEFNFEQLVEGISTQSERAVSDVMRPIKVFVYADDHLMKAIYEMVDTNISLLPVVKGNKVVGVIRSEEVLAETATLLPKHDT